MGFARVQPGDGHALHVKTHVRQMFPTQQVTTTLPEGQKLLQLPLQETQLKAATGSASSSRIPSADAAIINVRFTNLRRETNTAAC
jgi:hypothetical protein